MWPIVEGVEREKRRVVVVMVVMVGRLCGHGGEMCGDQSIIPAALCGANMGAS